MRFYRTVITYEFLHAEEELCNAKLGTLYDESINGHASGLELKRRTMQVSKATMRKLLVNQGSDPHFLDMEDEETYNADCEVYEKEITT